jgi:hypothetical protein
MSDVATKLRELNQTRAIIDAENAQKSAIANAYSLGLPHEVALQNGKAAYDDMYKAASMAVGSRPGNSDFNFFFHRRAGKPKRNPQSLSRFLADPAPRTVPTATSNPLILGWFLRIAGFHFRKMVVCPPGCALHSS